MVGITQQALREALRYEPDTGRFYWRKAGGRKRVNEPAGSLAKNGYVMMGVGGKSFWAHRLAWIYVYGENPAGDIDHINRDRADNRIENLRLATRNMNNGNTGVWKTNTSGYRGVSWEKAKQKYECYIWKLDRKQHLGYFDCPVNAALRYNLEAKEYFGEYATLNRIDNVKV